MPEAIAERKTNTGVATLPLLPLAALAALSYLPDIQANDRLLLSFHGALGATFAWWLAVAIRAFRSGVHPGIHVRVIRTHYVQALVLSCIYLYWGMNWEPVFEHVGLIGAQIVFAYLVSMLLSWSRGRDYALGFGPIPIILSMNLFLWFKDDWFFLQFVLVAVGFIGKEFVTWEKDGRRAHIFNPSAFALSLFAVVLLLTGSTDLTWGQEIAVAQFRPEYIYLEIFLLGLIVQALFGTTLVTVTAAASLWLLSSIYLQITGVYFFGDSTIPIAIFLGLHFLITDPATSPQTKAGRALFGLFYGVAAFVLFGALEALGQPTFYDKLLAVPLLNLSIQALDRMARSNWVKNLAEGAAGTLVPALQSNKAHMAIWALVFGVMFFTDEVGPQHAARQVEFWERACVEERRNACQSLVNMQGFYCANGRAAACNYLGRLYLEGRYIQADPIKAQESFASACRLGFESACLDELDMSQRREGHVAALAAGCEQNDGQSCALLGYAYYRGAGVPRDERQALEYVRKGCELGFAPACDIAKGSAPDP